MNVVRARFGIWN